MKVFRITSEISKAGVSAVLDLDNPPSGRAGKPAEDQHAHECRPSSVADHEAPIGKAFWACGRCRAFAGMYVIPTQRNESRTMSGWSLSGKGLMWLAIAGLATLFVWWLATGVVMCWANCSRRVAGGRLIGARLPLSRWRSSGRSFTTSSNTQSIRHLCSAPSALAVWAWHEMTFLFGS
jgi:hypothetical protein